MSFCRNKSPIQFDYVIGYISVKRVIYHTDLGVTFDNKLTFQPHINKVLKGSWKMLGFVTRSSRNLHTIKAMKSIYYSLLRSRLEYASIVWSPIYDVYSNKIDKIQKKFLKFLLWRTDGDYPDPGSDYVSLCSKFRVLSFM
ncbi:GSCOCG00010858001-RA-CDS [Cotesia congregata]|nr:GSCOCG00010858001-RA-CDS [Cotesia congregata]